MRRPSSRRRNSRASSSPTPSGPRWPRPSASRSGRSGGGRSWAICPMTWPPATVFDPRLPGTRAGPAAPGLVRSDASRVPAQPPSSDEDLAFAPVWQLSRWIESRQLTSKRLTALCLERLKRLDPKLKAVVTLTEELALKQAEQADSEIANGRYRGPLHGVPWGAKDLFDTAGIKTTWGAEPYRTACPRRMPRSWSAWPRRGRCSPPSCRSAPWRTGTSGSAVGRTIRGIRSAARAAPAPVRPRQRRRAWSASGWAPRHTARSCRPRPRAA
jgi:hypothetical protein